MGTGVPKFEKQCKIISNHIVRGIYEILFNDP